MTETFGKYRKYVRSDLIIERQQGVKAGIKETIGKHLVADRRFLPYSGHWSLYL